MRAEVVRPQELATAEVAAWRRMQEESPDLGSPFLAPEFTAAVGRARSDARVAVLREHGEIVGFFPFQRGRAGAGFPIGAGASDVQGVIHAPGFAWNPHDLLVGSGLHVWEFDHLLAGQASFAPCHVLAVPSPIIELGGGYDAYLQNRRHASERVRVALRKARKLERELGGLRFEFDARDRAALDVVLGWKSAQYRRTGHRDRFAWPWVSRLVADLFDDRADGAAGTLSLLWAGDRLVAGHFGLRSQRVLASWFPAYDVAAARYSPGWLLFLRMAEAAAERGLDHVDLGKGDEDYKQSLKTADLALAEGWVQRRSARALLRAAVREPPRRAKRFVQDRPALRSRARRLARAVARIRS